MTETKRSSFGLVLGGGGARGWAHLGLMEVLEREGYRPDVVAGCSIGAVVGAFYAIGKLDELRDFAQGMTVTGMAKFLDLNFAGGGLIGGNKITDWLETTFGDTQIEDLPIPFGTVSVDISTGREIWFTEGPLIDAVRASMVLPGVLPPQYIQGHWLGDGGMANPVPVSVVRALGAGLIVAVDLNGELNPFEPPHWALEEEEGGKKPSTSPVWAWFDRVTSGLPDPIRTQTVQLTEGLRQPASTAPGYLEFVTRSLQIMVLRITRSRLAGDPPDLLISPKLERINVLEFHRAKASIAEGARAAEEKLPALKQLLETPPAQGRPRLLPWS